MKFSRITTEQALLSLIVLVAFGLRILEVGKTPLSDFEADRALQAYHVSRGESTSLAPQPAYSLLTGATFFVFADNNFFARIWSVLAGCCLVIFPFLIRSLIGKTAALIMALGLAFDAVLVTGSRFAGSDVLAVGFGLMVLGFVYNRKPIAAGLFGGLMILSGPSAMQGILSFGFAWLIGIFLSKRGVLEPFQEEMPVENKAAIRSGVLAGGVVILVLGTLFFLTPEGLGAVTSFLSEYIIGWFSPSGIPFLRLVAAMFVYHPLPLIFGTLAIIRGWKQRESFSQWLSLWAGTSLALALLYPGRQVIDVAWVLIPLWALAAIEITKIIRLAETDKVPVIGQVFLILLLLALAWINLAGLSMSMADVTGFRLRWLVIGGTIVLGAITTILIGLGWSIKTAQKGLVWGLVVGVGLYSFATMWNSTQIRPNGEQDLIAPVPMAKNAGDLLVTLNNLSEWRTGIGDALDIVVTSSAPSLHWALRNWSEARYLNSVPTGELPSVIINSEDQPSPSLPVGYRGQDFAWWVSPAWEGILPENWTSWLVFREAPQIENKVILWARGDLFPGGVLSPVEETVPLEEDDFPFEDSPIR
jgi:hypothetical protein